MRWCIRIFIWLMLGMVFSTHAQPSSSWRIYKASDGLAESFATSVSFSQKSNVWVGHMDAPYVTLLDGYRVKQFPAPERGGNQISEGRSGQIWTTHFEGLQELKNGAWVRYPIREIRQEYQTNALRHARSLPIVPIKHNTVLFLLPDRLMQFNNDWAPQPEVVSLYDAEKANIGRFSDMVLGRDGTLWILGQSGLLRLTNASRISVQSSWQVERVDARFGVENLQQAIPDDAGGLTAIGDARSIGRKTIVHFDGFSWSVHFPGNYLIRNAWRVDKTFWATTVTALLRQTTDGTFVEDKMVPATQFFDVATAANGVFWLATAEGLVRHTPALWQLDGPAEMDQTFIRVIWQNADGMVWAANNETVANHADGKWTAHRISSDGAGSFATDPIYPLHNGRMVERRDGKWKLLDFARGNDRDLTREAIEVLGRLPDGTLAVRQKNALRSFDGTSVTTLPSVAAALQEFGEISAVFTISSHEIWVMSPGKFVSLDNGRQFTLPVGHPGIETITSVIRVADKVWCGTRDSLWQFDGRRWEALRPFDRVNSMMIARDGSVWVCSNGGLFRYLHGDWIQHTMSQGLPSDVVTAVCEDNVGKLWIGTARGLVVYYPQADMDPPQTQIKRVTMQEEGQVTIDFNGEDKWRVTSSSDLLFSYRIDERDWTPFRSDRSVALRDLPSGTHYFQVRAVDRNWNISPQPALIDFEVLAPWYKETRLLFVVLIGLGITLFFAALAFNRHRRLLRSYAEVEKIVRLRTRQLEEANEQILHNQKMTALGSLAAGVAHDFNSILSIIKGSAQIIEKNLNDPEKIRVRAERIQGAVQQGSEVIKALLGFSRPAEDHKADCDVNQVIQETVHLLGDRFKRRKTLVYQRRDVLPLIKSSPDLLRQILVNFILNAADAIEDDGEIEVRAELVKLLPPNVTLSPRGANLYVSISVCDDGAGIPESLLPRIFEPFFTTKGFSSRRGTGLGLSMVYQLAKELNCGLGVESTVGKGSKFTLYIPVGLDHDKPPSHGSEKSKSFLPLL